MISKSACSRLIQVIIDVITVFIVSIVFLLIYLLVHPFERGFYCNDDSIRYPYKKEDTIPLWVAGVYGAVSAFFVIIFTELFVNRPCCIDESQFRTKRNKCNTAIATALLIFSMGAMATMLITEIGKRTIGRLRSVTFKNLKPFNNIFSHLDLIFLTFVNRNGKKLNVMKSD
jgi:phosphatidate phosphatase